MNVDPTGTLSWKGFFKLLAAIAIVVVATAVVAITAGAAAVAIAGAVGVTAAMASTIGTTVALTAAVAGIVVGSCEIANQSLEKGIENINLTSILVSTVGGACDGAMIAGSMFAGPVGKLGLGITRVGLSAVTSASYGVSEGLSKDEINRNILLNVLATTIFCFMPSTLSYSQVLFKPLITGLIKGGFNLGKLYIKYPELM